MREGAAGRHHLQPMDGRGCVGSLSKAARHVPMTPCIGTRGMGAHTHTHLHTLKHTDIQLHTATHTWHTATWRCKACRVLGWSPSPSLPPPTLNSRVSGSAPASGATCLTHRHPTASTAANATLRDTGWGRQWQQWGAHMVIRFTPAPANAKLHPTPPTSRAKLQRAQPGKVVGKVSGTHIHTVDGAHSPLRVADHIRPQASPALLPFSFVARDSAFTPYLPINPPHTYPHPHPHPHTKQPRPIHQPHPPFPKGGLPPVHHH